MKIVFGIMSAVHSAEAVDQLANALAPWPVVVHHDFVQTPDFKLTASNVTFVAVPKRTGWAVWGFSEGILLLLETCINDFDADYFQLLSPTCLPVRPITEFVEHVESNRYDAHIGAADISLDTDLAMNFGYRAYARKDSFKFRFLRRLRKTYFGSSKQKRSVANMQTLCLEKSSLSVGQRIAKFATSAARKGWLGSHPFVGSQLRPMIGGTWFGCRKDAGQYLISRMRDVRRREQFSAMSIPDEMLFASVFWSSPFDIGSPNHFVNTFNEHNPGWVECEDLPVIKATGCFFARKFRDDATDQARSQALSLTGVIAAGESPRTDPDQLPQRAGMAVSHH